MTVTVAPTCSAGVSIFVAGHDQPGSSFFVSWAAAGMATSQHEQQQTDQDSGHVLPSFSGERVDTSAPEQVS